MNLDLLPIVVFGNKNSVMVNALQVEPVAYTLMVCI